MTQALVLIPTIHHRAPPHQRYARRARRRTAGSLLAVCALLTVSVTTHAYYQERETQPMVERLHQVLSDIKQGREPSVPFDVTTPDAYVGSDGIYLQYVDLSEQQCERLMTTHIAGVRSVANDAGTSCISGDNRVLMQIDPDQLSGRDR